MWHWNMLYIELQQCLILMHDLKYFILRMRLKHSHAWHKHLRCDTALWSKCAMKRESIVGLDSMTGWVCDEMRQCDGLSVITLSHIIKLSQSYQAITSHQAVLILTYFISSILSSPQQAVPFCYTTASHSHQADPIQSYHHAVPIISNYSVTPSCPHPHTMTKSSCPHLSKSWKTIKLSPSY